MSAAKLPAPGTVLGPCPRPCEHTDCAAARIQAKDPCAICNKPIGWETRFYKDEGRLVHAACLESRYRR